MANFLMFHHFHDKNKHYKGQGSFNKKMFEKVIKKIGIKNIANSINDIKKKNKFFFTFDDGLASQHDIALPILNKYKIKGIFFIHTNREYSRIEIFRYFRHKYFKTINQFYDFFYKTLNEEKVFISKKNVKEIEILKIKNSKLYKYHTQEDLKFRIIRDNFLSHNQYEKIMFKMMKIKKFNYKKKNINFFMTNKNIKNIFENNHYIGIHSHSHSTDISSKSYYYQLKDYSKNKKILEKLINSKIFLASYPCGRYNSNSLKVMKKLKINYAFIDTINKKKFHKHKIPRINSASFI